jgi:N-acyl homoserine lactone hydrolase
MTLTIRVLPAGVIRNFPQAAITYHRGWTEVLDVPQMFFAILGGERPVLVDSGTPPQDFVREHHGYDFERGPELEPAKVLAEAGVDPADIGVVIFTHLHWDHCGNTELFPNAQFYVQRSELHYAIDPAEPHRAAFERTDRINPPWLPALSRFVTLDGEFEVAPGITIVPLPGHTPGSQGVLVETAEDRYLLAGDCIDTRRNWEGDGNLRHIPSGSYTDMLAYMDSFRRIERLGATVVPSHDPEVLTIGEFG